MRNTTLLLTAMLLLSVQAQTSNGPDAPDLTVTWNGTGFDMVLTNPPGSNNVNESYIEQVLPAPAGSPDPFWRFQGYMVFQLASPALQDSLAYRFAQPANAKAVVVTDLQDGISSLQYDLDLGGADSCFLVTWTLPNAGLQTSFTVIEDPFTQQPYLPDSTYCFLATAFASTPVHFDTECSHVRTLLFSRNSAQGSLQATCLSPITQAITSPGTSGFTVWPVPASDVVHVSGVEAGAEWVLTDGLGRFVRSGPGTGGREVFTLGLHGLASGTYHLTIDVPQGRRVFRLMVE